ncbi:MAG: hypothetical protein E6Q88_14060 [Lysobacteraceae bacterium]|nr:MAG: hypothetical protein E6Q88_14060 [Xanthomonadaceae bacterium]
MGSFETFPPSQQLAIGPWRIDLERNTVVVGREGPSGLTPRAEQLLLLLARYPNLLVTREQILEVVWAGRVVEDAAITNCVWQIRKALGEAGKERLQTRARRGYVLSVDDGDWIIDPSPQSRLANADQNAVAQPAPVAEAASSSSASVADAPSAPTRSVSQPLRRGLSAATVIVLIVMAALYWRSWGHAPEHIKPQPQADLMVSVAVPETMDWLRANLLRSVVEAAYLRGTPVVVAQKPPQRIGFVATVLQIDVAAERSGDVKANMALRHGERRIDKVYAGPATELGGAVKVLLEEALPPTSAEPSPAGDAFVAGLVDDLRFDYLGALAGYRRALAIRPGFFDAKIAMAWRLVDLGALTEAQRILNDVGSISGLSDAQRCRYELLIARVSPEKTSEHACAYAQIQAGLNPTGAKEALRRAEAIDIRALGATEWYWVQAMAVEAKQYLGLHTEAEFRARQAEQIAAEAGWDQARWQFQAVRCKSILYTGRNEEGVRACNESADALEAIGDLSSALPPRILAARLERPEPGPTTATQRALYRRLIDQARAIGSPQNEIDALDALIALDRDDPPVWESHLSRLRELADRNYTGDMRARVIYNLITEQIPQRRFDRVLAQVEAFDHGGQAASRPELTRLYLKAQAYFALDRLEDAVGAIGEMERNGFDLADTNPCLFSWLFVEVGKPEQARTLLKACPYEQWDSRSKAGLRGDWGLLAFALLHRIEREPERSWPTVRPRIDELLANEHLGRLEAEGLAFLARHATAMPGADLQRLERALAVTTDMAKKDGAGPNLRFGVHVLRWRLCKRKGGNDCGAVLPVWAPHDRLEARLAEEAVGLRTVSRR